MADPPRFRAFISYRHEEPDRSLARWLHGALETYAVPGDLVRAGQPARLGRVFRDEEELAASPDLSERIEQALADSGALVVVCSPRTPPSRWVNAEIERFHALGRADRIFAVLLEGTPESSFPPALAATGHEPLAVDLRAGEGETQRAQRRVALLKLVAGLLRIDYDALRRRDDERRRRRWAIAAGAATALLAVVTGLAVFAGLQWRRAEDQLTLAQARRLAALGQAALAESRQGDRCPVCADSNRAALLALESLRLRPTPEADAVLRHAVWDRSDTARPFATDDTASVAGVRIDDAGALTVVRGEYRGGLEPGDDLLATTRDGRLRARRWQATTDPLSREGVAIETGEGRVLRVLPHEWTVAQARFSADGRWLTTVTGKVSTDAQDPSATALPGSAVRVWEVADGRLRTEVSFAAAGGVQHAAFSPSGLWIATIVDGPGEGSARYRALAWPVEPRQLAAQACARLERNLSDSEWQTFVGATPWRETCPGLPKLSE